MHPGFSFVIAHIQSPIITQSQMIGMAGIDPQLAVIEMQRIGRAGKNMVHIAAHQLEGFTSVRAVGHPDTESENLFIIFGIDITVCEIPTDPGKDLQLLLVGAAPALSPIQSAVYFSRRTFVFIQVVYQGIDFIGIGPGYGHPNASGFRSDWKTVLQARPGLAHITTSIDPAFLPGDSRIVLPHGDIDVLRRRGSNNYIIGSCPFVDIQHMFPGFSAIKSPVQAPVGIGRPEMPHDRH